MRSAHVLIFCAQAQGLNVLATSLRARGHQVSCCDEPEALFDRLNAHAYDLLVLPIHEGAEALVERVGRLARQLPVLVAADSPEAMTMSLCLARGARGLVASPWDTDDCATAIEQHLKPKVSAPAHAVRALFEQRYRTEDLIIHSASTKKMFELATAAAPSRSTILITGESGTGKEKVARFVHDHSRRAHRPFLAINCGAIAPGVLESELFGHVRGAFTGASHDRRGVFEQAHGGTLFLDEIGETTPAFQAKLLRVLQEREVWRVGASAGVEVDVRIIAATNRTLEHEIAQGNFRQDLFFRLAVIPLHVPPLRDRPDEILPLARHFFRRACHELEKPLQGWSQEVEAWFVSYQWPGNVRELENFIERAVVLACGPQILWDDLMIPAAAEPHDEPRSLQEIIDRATIEHVQALLKQHQGSRAAVAASLGVERTTLYRIIKRYDLDVV